MLVRRVTSNNPCFINIADLVLSGELAHRPTVLRMRDVANRSLWMRCLHIQSQQKNCYAMYVTAITLIHMKNAVSFLRSSNTIRVLNVASYVRGKSGRKSSAPLPTLFILSYFSFLLFTVLLLSPQIRGHMELPPRLERSCSVGNRTAMKRRYRKVREY
jgi:hypothetical protein